MYHHVAPAFRQDGQNFHMQGGQYYTIDTDLAHRQRIHNTNQTFEYIDPDVSFKKN